MLLFRRVHEWIFTLLFRPFFFFDSSFILKEYCAQFLWHRTILCKYNLSRSWTHRVMHFLKSYSFSYNGKVSNRHVDVHSRALEKTSNIIFLFFSYNNHSLLYKRLFLSCLRKKGKKNSFFSFFFAISLLNS